MPSQPTQPTQPSAELVDMLVQSAFTTMAVLTRVAAAHDLSLTQLRVLGILRDRQVRMTELADYLGLEKSTMSGLIARSQARGLVQRMPNPTDGRAVDVRLTAVGHELADRVATRVAAELAPSTAGLSAHEQRRLAGALHRTVS
jgi:DNA-binding MarR family transcriptional regulator